VYWVDSGGDVDAVESVSDDSAESIDDDER
jgi:hypothetical protein